MCVLLGISAHSGAQTNASKLPSVPGSQLGHDSMGFDNRMVELVVVEDADNKECKEIGAKARALLANRNFEELDKLADNLRTSKRVRANGTWLLFNLYTGLTPGSKADEADFETRLASLRAWIEARPESITARVALADTLISYAWLARGSGWANTVTETGWRLFAERIQQAVKVLDDARTLKAKCPVYWSVRLLAAMASSMERPDYDAMFEAAVRSEPDYEGFYYRRSIYLLPRWLGAPGELAEDTANSANKIGGRAGDRLYTQVVWGVHEYGGSKNVLEENNFSWPRVDRGFQDIEKLYPASLAALSEHARLAVLAHDREQAHKCFEALNGRLVLSAWKSKQQFIEYSIWSGVGRAFHEPSNTIKPTEPSESLRPEPVPSSSIVVVKPELYPELALKVISGAPGHRMAQINNQTLMVGESGKVRVRDTKVEVVCKEIREDSVLITVDGKPMELKLGAKPAPQKTAQK